MNQRGKLKFVWMALAGLALLAAPLGAVCGACCPAQVEAAAYAAPELCCGEECERLAPGDRPASTPEARAGGPSLSLAAEATLSRSDERLSERAPARFSNDMSPPLPARQLSASLRL